MSSSNTAPITDKIGPTGTWSKRAKSLSALDECVRASHVTDHTGGNQLTTRMAYRKAYASTEYQPDSLTSTVTDQAFGTIQNIKSYTHAPHTHPTLHTPGEPFQYTLTKPQLRYITQTRYIWLYKTPTSESNSHKSEEGLSGYRPDSETRQKIMRQPSRVSPLLTKLPGRIGYSLRGGAPQL